MCDNMTLNKYLKEIEQFLKDYLKNSHQDKYILGISGGVDSSLCAAIAKNAVGKDKLHCLIIPINSIKEDMLDALTLVKELDLNYTIIDASETFNSYLSVFENSGISLDQSTLGNLKARMRMAILYAVAQKERGLVIGTDNADERFTGYFTKYGDGASDIMPIAHLLKCEVVEAAKLYNISSLLAERVPSAGLYQGQTDEKEMGVKYDDLDAYLLNKQIDEEAKKRIEHLNTISEHKRKDIPMPKPFIRGK